MFAGTGVSQLIKDSDYDSVEDPVDRQKLEDLYFRKGRTVYPCGICGRLLIQWDDNDAPQFYKPEGKLTVAQE
jgi:hypothetical protein